LLDSLGSFVKNGFCASFNWEEHECKPHHPP
jgi:hypothetical protein